MNNNFSESFIENLFKEEKLPDSWDYNYNLTYLDFNKLFKYIDENNLQNKDILPVLKLLYNRDMEFSLGSISNFKRKVQRYFKRNEHDVEYLNLPALNLDASSHSSNSIGPYCDKIALTKSLISSVWQFGCNSCHGRKKIVPL